MEPIDTISAILPFLVVFGFEGISVITGLKYTPEACEASNRRSPSQVLLDVSNRVERLFREFDSSGYELIEARELDRALRNELNKYYEEDSETFDDAVDELTMALQHDVSLNEADLATLAQEYTQFAYDCSRLIISGLATLVSYLVVVFARVNNNPISYKEVLIWTVFPVVILLILGGIVLFVRVKSAFDYGSLTKRLPFSPISGIFLMMNFAIIIGITLIDTLVIGYC